MLNAILLPQPKR